MKRVEGRSDKSSFRILHFALCISSLRLFTIFYLLFTILAMPVLALEFDTTLDDDVRRNYNPNKIEQDMALPALPKILNEINTQSTQISKTATPTQNAVTAPPQPTLQHATNLQAIPQKQYKKTASQENYATIKQGTKIRVKLQTSISDKSKKGTKVSFVSKYPVSTTYFTIPMGTTFRGEIVNSHKPQFSGNGGLIVIKINSIILNNEIHPINAYVTEANSKKIFLNNIKGKRKYVASMFKSMHPGCHYFQKMLGLSWDLARDGSSIFVAPFSLILGTVAAGGNIIAAPAIALFYKGGSVYINANSDFEIKLLQDVFIYK